MRKLNLPILLLLLLNSFISCNNRGEENIAVKVGSSPLYFSQIDSIWFQNSNIISYTEQWAKDELLYLEAIDLGLNKQHEVKKQIEDAKRQIIISSYLDHNVKPRINVKNTEIKKYYDEHIDEFIAETKLYKFRYFIVNDNQLSDSIKIILNENPLCFDSLMILYSNNSIEYDPDYLTSDELPPIIKKNLNQFSKSSIVGPVNSDFGFYFIKQVNTKSKGEYLDLEDVEYIISSKLFAVKYDSLISLLTDSLSEKYDIYFNPELIGDL